MNFNLGNVSFKIEYNKVSESVDNCPSGPWEGALASYDEVLLLKNTKLYTRGLQGLVPSSRCLLIPEAMLILGLKEGLNLQKTMLVDLETFRITILQDSHYPKIHSGAVYLHPYVYCIGGASDLKKPLVAFNFCEKLNLETRTWETMSDLPKPKMNLGVCSYRSNIYVVGGRSSENNKLGTIEKYTVAYDFWETLSVTVTNISHIACMPVTQGILMIGGEKYVAYINLEKTSLELQFQMDACYGDCSIVNSLAVFSRGVGKIFTGFVVFKITDKSCESQRINCLILKNALKQYPLY